MDDVPAPEVGGLAALVGEARTRLARFDEWRRDLTGEVAQLPDTMRRFRQGAANFELVGERLAKSSAALEGITDLYESTIADSSRRSVQAMDALKAQLEALTAGAASPERVTSSVNEIQRALETITDLNPFWPKSPRQR